MVGSGTLQLFRNQCHWLIVSDLDGTLLDHFDYNHRAVDDLLTVLERQHIPVVFNSSKTAGEMLHLRREFNNHHPFIVENGSAIYIPDDYFGQNVLAHSSWHREEVGSESFWVLKLGAGRGQLCDFLKQDQLHHTAPYLSFSQASQEQLIEATGLSIEKVMLAQQRRYSEPLLWQGSDTEKSAFSQRAGAAGFNTLQGGRFLHLQGQCNKGLTTQKLGDVYRQYGVNSEAELQNSANTTWFTIACGDSGNDVDMLQAADIAVVVRSPTHAAPTISNHSHVVYSNQCGPEGWKEVIGELVQYNLIMNK